MSNHKSTPGARWREAGEPDPHAGKYDQERAELCLGHMSDDELANEVFLNGDKQPTVDELIAGNRPPPFVLLTAAKERIRWLSRALAKATGEEFKKWAITPPEIWAIRMSLEGNANAVRERLLVGGQLDVVRYVAEKGAVTSTDMAKDTGRSMPCASQLLARLYEKRYLARSEQPNPGGGYEFVYRLAPWIQDIPIKPKPEAHDGHTETENGQAGEGEQTTAGTSGGADGEAQGPGDSGHGSG